MFVRGREDYRDANVRLPPLTGPTELQDYHPLPDDHPFRVRRLKESIAAGPDLTVKTDIPQDDGLATVLTRQFEASSEEANSDLSSRPISPTNPTESGFTHSGRNSTAVESGMRFPQPSVSGSLLEFGIRRRNSWKRLKSEFKRSAIKQAVPDSDTSEAQGEVETWLRPSPPPTSQTVKRRPRKGSDGSSWFHR
jgi:hypothetical protein